MTLKQLRINKGLTQVEASNFCHIPLRTYKRLENDSSYTNTLRYKEAINVLKEYNKKDIDGGEDIVIIGAGYVGFSLGVLLGLHNHVSIIDINKEKIDLINQGISPIKDKNINKYTNKSDIKGYLLDINLYRDKEYIMIALPTDYDEKTGLLDTSHIYSLVKDIRVINKTGLIIIKSTCNIGFTESLNDKNVIYVPEFLREGSAIQDNLYPSRIIVGVDNNNSKVKKFVTLLLSCSYNRPQVLYMSSKEAEAVKLFSNAYLAMRVSYFNELDSLMIKEGLNTRNVINGVSLDPRIGDYYNNPSFGYGGYCLPKDTLSLISQMSGVESELIPSIDRSNRKRKELIVKDILSKIDKNSVVGILGDESKRYSPINDIARGLVDSDINVLYYNSLSMSINEFKTKCDLIITDRYDSSLDDVKYKIYTRDINK